MLPNDIFQRFLLNGKSGRKLRNFKFYSFSADCSVRIFRIAPGTERMSQMAYLHLIQNSKIYIV